MSAIFESQKYNYRTQGPNGIIEFKYNSDSGTGRYATDDPQEVSYLKSLVNSPAPGRHIKLIQDLDTEPDWEEKVQEYYSGNSWYDLPNRENSVRKEEAIEALKELEGE